MNDIHMIGLMVTIVPGKNLIYELITEKYGKGTEFEVFLPPLYHGNSITFGAIVGHSH